jgi:hypothetical protein
MPIPRKVLFEPEHNVLGDRKPARLEITATGTQNTRPLFTLTREGTTPRGRAKYDTVYLYSESFLEAVDWMMGQWHNWPPGDDVATTGTLDELE